MKELEVITIGNQDYFILKEINFHQTIYLFLSNIIDSEDMMIRKSSKNDPNYYVPLESEEEYYLATQLLFQDANEKND